MPLTLTADQHRLLGHALALAHALHSEMAGNGLGVTPGEVPAVYDDVDIYVQPGAHGGAGFFSTLGDAVAKGAKQLQKSTAVRGLEKKAVSYGATALRTATEGALDGLGDTVATAVGAPPPLTSGCDTEAVNSLGDVRRPADHHLLATLLGRPVRLWWRELGLRGLVGALHRDNPAAAWRGASPFLRHRFALTCRW